MLNARVVLAVCSVFIVIGPARAQEPPEPVFRIEFNNGKVAPQRLVSVVECFETVCGVN